MTDIYNRKDLVVDVDKKLMPGRYTHKEIDEIICAALTAIATAVGEGRHVSIHGFGAWQAVERRERVGRSLYGERVEIPQRRRVKFRRRRSSRMSPKTARAHWKGGRSRHVARPAAPPNSYVCALS